MPWNKMELNKPKLCSKIWVFFSTLPSTSVESIDKVWIVYMKLVGADTNDRTYKTKQGYKRYNPSKSQDYKLTIFLVHPTDFECVLPSPETVVIKLIPYCCCRESWSGELRKRVQIKPIDNKPDNSQWYKQKNYQNLMLKQNVNKIHELCHSEMEFLAIRKNFDNLI